ncbi:Protein TolB [Lachnellula suecica]|uniref:Protein TolB n=1 Tax=Lachnellula suecica TaxID=602035 RepID=A0A8T9CCC5_9HELO|nr:Protein TolB [Lachnellula suecica]
MRLSFAFVVILAGLAAGNPNPCPHAENKKMASRDCPYASRLTRDANPHKAALPKRAPASGTLGVMYMNRIAPNGGQLYIANSDGSNATKLMGNQTDPFDYHANWSLDGEWIVFTSERRGDGQADVYRVKPDGTGLETLISTDSFEDGGVLSPDGTQLAYVSTAINYTANVFVKDLATNISTNVTGSDETIGNYASPHSFLRPSWSPDGQFIALSSDANTDWTGHSNGTGWEHTQQLSIYVVRPNGSDFRKVIGESQYSLGTPKWSADGTRIIYNNMTVEDTYGAHGVSTQEAVVVSQICSVDVATGLDVIQHTTEDTLKVAGQFIGNSSNVGYLIKTGTSEGVNYTIPESSHSNFSGTIRSPSWSPDGTKVVYEVLDWSQRPAEKELWSFDPQWDYRNMDVFPQLNNATGRLVTTQKVLGNASGNVLTTDADYTNPLINLNVYDVNNTAAEVEMYLEGGAGAFQPTWKPDGSQITVGFGGWFAARTEYPGILYTANATSEDSTYDAITNSSLNAGFPSYSPDGTKIVYRLWDWEKTGAPLGLRIMDLETGNITALTWGWDNTPGWSPDGELIVFTRQTNWTASYGPRWYADRYDIATIKPDGTELTILTESAANDAHAVWSQDGRIMYNTGMYGFRDECALYDNTFQPYGQIMIMNADGSNKTLLTDTMWEDSMPQYVPAALFD